MCHAFRQCGGVGALLSSACTQKTGEWQMPGDLVEVANTVRAFAECWNRHDMAAFAELFAADAEFVNAVGLWWKGGEEIRKAHEVTHATIFKNSQLSISDVSIRFPAETIAIARCRWVLEGHVSPEGRRLSARNGILVHVLSRNVGRWSIIDSQNTDIIEGVPSRPQ